ncbi:MAG: S-layer homology domain-containing protein [Nitrospirota bacterium]
MKKLFSVVVSICMLVSIFQTAVFANESIGFTDLSPEHDYYAAITYLSQIGVLNGYSDGTFGPDNTINRAEVLKVIFVGSEIDVSDVPSGDVWYGSYMNKAYELGIVSGDGVDGEFHGERDVNKAEFLKMLLEANQIMDEALAGAAGIATANDVPADEWFAPYLNYAALIGVIELNSQGGLEPDKALTRGEVSNMFYLLMLIRGKDDTRLLLDAAELEMIQIDVYVGADKIDRAKKASELAVDLTQQALANAPGDDVVLGVAKLAKAYDYLVEAFILGAHGDYTGAENWANDAIDKAEEAWEVDDDTEIIARYIKEVARSILQQIGGVEY